MRRDKPHKTSSDKTTGRLYAPSCRRLRLTCYVSTYTRCERCFPILLSSPSTYALGQSFVSAATADSKTRFSNWAMGHVESRRPGVSQPEQVNAGLNVARRTQPRHGSMLCLVFSLDRCWACLAYNPLDRGVGCGTCTCYIRNYCQLSMRLIKSF